MSAPLVTVYITNYNYGHFIKQAINSVLQQTYSPIEILIIDDGSTDNSKEVINRYESLDNITVIYQQNKGLNITNNIALRVSKGKYIVRLDADDYFTNDAIELMVEKLEQDENLGLVFPDYFYVDANGKIIGEHTRHDFDSDVSLFDQAAHGACTMIRSSFLKNLGGYNENFSCQDGYELWVKFISHYKVTNINEPLFFYRQHGKNLTSNEKKILRTRAAINKSILEMQQKTLKSLAIIPVRGGTDTVNFETINGKTLLEIKVEQAALAQNVARTVIVAENEQIESFVRENLGQYPNLIFVQRPEKLSRFNISLSKTTQFVIDRLQIKDISTICLLSVEFPFADEVNIDDAHNTLEVFGSDSLITVRPELSSFYQHHGNGMVSILQQDQVPKLERDALYRNTGAITVTRVNKFLETGQIINGLVGHAFIDQKAAFGIKTAFDLSMAKMMSTEEINL
jgi:CMP-N-acetylneuraminic acid synthetase